MRTGMDDEIFDSQSPAAVEFVGGGGDGFAADGALSREIDEVGSVCDYG